MLSGRESVIRLVGKRRRFLPNRHHLLSDSSPQPHIIKASNRQPSSSDFLLESQTTLNNENERTIVISMTGETGGKSKLLPSSDWVTCPVCASKIVAQDSIINSHLDSCLTRGTKRKLTQRTLFQLNFCSKRMAHSPIEKLETGTMQEDTAFGFDNCAAAVEENESNLAKLLPTKEPVLETSKDDSIMEQKLTDYDENKCRVDPSLWILRNEQSQCNEAVNVNGMSGMILDTFIVGHRFNVEKEELNLGTNITLLRDPDNAKDSNAIQVLSTDSRCCKVLGYLPRELARYLSPLIDKHSLTFKGCITSAPKHCLDVVPIQIECCKAMLLSDKEHNEIEDFTCSWKNVLHVVESAEKYSLSMTKYQHNFCVLIQEVLASNPHLFNDDEIFFIESFVSLSDNSQRLFVRLYTRKGPWFRMSNVSYPEVLDSQQAIKDLIAIGYMCNFDGTTEKEENDIEKILNLLTVFELREITSMFKEKQHHQANSRTTGY